MALAPPQAGNANHWADSSNRKVKIMYKKFFNNVSDIISLWDSDQITDNDAMHQIYDLAYPLAAQQSRAADLPSAPVGCRCFVSIESYNNCPVHGTANR